MLPHGQPGRRCSTRRMPGRRRPVAFSPHTGPPVGVKVDCRDAGSAPNDPAAKSAWQEAAKPMRRRQHITPQQVLSVLLENQQPDPAATLLARRVSTKTRSGSASVLRRLSDEGVPAGCPWLADHPAGGLTVTSFSVAR
jgi:hypothetical protein